MNPRLHRAGAFVVAGFALAHVAAGLQPAAGQALIPHDVFPIGLTEDLVAAEVPGGWVQAVVEGHGVRFARGYLGIGPSVFHPLPSRPLRILMEDGSDIVEVVTEDGVVHVLDIDLSSYGFEVTAVSATPTSTAPVVGAGRSGAQVVVHSGSAATGVDCSDPANPILTGTVVSPSWLYDVCMAGGRLHAANGDQLVQISPSGTLITGIPGAWRVDDDGAHVVVAAGATLEIRSSDTNALLGSVQAPDPFADVAVRGEIFAGVTHRAELFLGNLADPGNPDWTGPYPLHAIAPMYLAQLHLTAQGTAVWAAGTRAGEFDPARTDRLLARGGDVRSLAFARNLVVASAGSDGVFALPDPRQGALESARPIFADGFESGDVSTWSSTSPLVGGAAARRGPGDPVTLPEPADVWALAATSQGVAVLQLQRNAPVRKANGISGTVGKVVAFQGPGGARLALALQASQLTVLNLADPLAPAVVSTLPVAAALDVTVDGTLAAVARNGGTTLLVDLADPANPQVIGPSPVAGQTAVTDGDRAYAGSGYRLHVGDISDPSAPVYLGSFDLNANGSVYDISIEHRAGGVVWAWLATGNTGVAVVDVTDATNMFLVTSYDTPGIAWDVELRQGFVWVADGGSGIHRLRLVTDDEVARGVGGPGAPVVGGPAGTAGSFELRAFPNPSRGPATVSFQLARAADVTVDVYDVSGRRVTQVLSGALRPGTHGAVWDGRDAHGRRAAAGVYLVRLQVGAAHETHRLVRLE